MVRRITAPTQKSQVLHSSPRPILGAYPAGRKDLNVEPTSGEAGATSRRLLALFLLGVFAALAGTRAAAAQAQTEKTASPQGRVQVERYQIEVSFQPEKSFLHARARVTLGAEPGLTAIELDLNPHLQILEVTDAQARKLGFTRSQRLGSPKLSVRDRKSVV